MANPLAGAKVDREVVVKITWDHREREVGVAIRALLGFFSSSFVAQ